jgi:DNA processing protein
LKKKVYLKNAQLNKLFYYEIGKQPFNSPNSVFGRLFFLIKKNERGLAMEERFILFGLHQVKGIGWKTVQNITQTISSLQVLLTASLQEVMMLGLEEKLAITLKEQLTVEKINQKLEIYQQRDIHILTIFDEDYPALLKEIAQPPWVLYYKGKLQSLKCPMMAVVGTRVPTVYGRRLSQQLSSELSMHGFGVVSGLARGIDSNAHQGALQRPEGCTIAVMGTGFDTIYPKENARLFEAIIKQGLVLTETPLHTPFHPGLFPIRNRIISGLSLGTIIIEAAEKSGSLITADQALEQCRDVFALPGPVNSPKSIGCLKLIQQGAKCIITIEDILEEYAHILPDSSNNTGNNNSEIRQLLTIDEQNILNLLSHEPVTFDEIFEKCKFEFGHLHSVLLNLLMKNKIDQLPGSTYIRN